MRGRSYIEITAIWEIFQTAFNASQRSIDIESTVILKKLEKIKSKLFESLFLHSDRYAEFQNLKIKNHQLSTVFFQHIFLFEYPVIGFDVEWHQAASFTIFLQAGQKSFLIDHSDPFLQFSNFYNLFDTFFQLHSKL